MRAPLVSLLIATACASTAPRATPPAAPAPAPDVAIASRETPAPPSPAPPLAPRPLADAPAWRAPAARPRVVEVLAQVPVAARFVAGVDVARLARGPLASRFQGMLAMVGVMTPASCGAVSLSQFDQVIVAGVGTKGDHVVFLGPAFAERTAADCLTAATMKRNGVTVNRRTAFGTTVYAEAGPTADGSALAWSKRSGPIIADHEPWLLAALDPKAAKADPELVALATSADHGRTFWLAALVSAEAAAGLAPPPNSLPGPFALRMGVDIDGEAEVDVDLVFATEAAAVEAAAGLRSQFAPMQEDPGTTLRFGVHGTEVRLILHFDAAAVQRFLALLPAS